MGGAELNDLLASSLDIRWHLDPVEATGAGLAQFDRHDIIFAGRSHLLDGLGAGAGDVSGTENRVLDPIPGDVSDRLIVEYVFGHLKCLIGKGRKDTLSRRPLLTLFSYR